MLAEKALRCVVGSQQGMVEFSVGQQPGVAGDVGAVEFEAEIRASPVPCSVVHPGNLCSRFMMTRHRGSSVRPLAPRDVWNIYSWVGTAWHGPPSSTNHPGWW